MDNINILEQKELLYVDTNKVPVLKDILMPGVDAQPLFLDPANGTWILRVIFAPGITLPKHFHSGAVHLWTMSGSWHYLEHANEPQTAGCYLYEPGASIHQFHTPETNTEPTEFITVSLGANVNFDENDDFSYIMDAGWLDKLLKETVQRAGLEGVKYVGAPQPMFINL